MGSGMFNREQEDHMDHLDSLSPESKCWCGWYELGKCPHCPAVYTCRDKINAACQDCGNAPGSPEGKLTHRKGCPAEPPRSFPVTDPCEDAPDGAVVEGYERHGRTWEEIDERSPDKLPGGE